MTMLLLLTLALLVKDNVCFAQQTDTTAQNAPWHVHAELNGFIYPNRADSYIDPIVWAKKGHLHLETRYNYEDLQTISLYGGYNLAFGKKLHLDLTPMLGGATGNTDAILPAAEFEIMYARRVGLYTETEYAFDLNNSDDNFFLWWGELYYSPQEWVWFGIATQRLRVRESERDFAAGVNAGISERLVHHHRILFQSFHKRSIRNSESWESRFRTQKPDPLTARGP